MTSLRQELPPHGQLGLFDIELDLVSAAHVPSTMVADATPPRRVRSDGSNAGLLKGLTLVAPYDIPRIGACQLVPEKLIAFSESMSQKTPDPEAWVHFYEDDYRFQRLWASPEAYMPRLRGFAGIITPDFSVFRNMPSAEKIHQIYRNQLLGARMQADGLNVIANVRLSGRDSIPYAIAGTPSNSTVALGLHGCPRSGANRRHVLEEISIMCTELTPSNIVVYGSAAYQVLEYPRERGIAVHIFRPDAFERSRSRRQTA